MLSDAVIITLIIVLGLVAIAEINKKSSGDNNE